MCLCEFHWQIDFKSLSSLYQNYLVFNTSEVEGPHPVCSVAKSFRKLFESQGLEMKLGSLSSRATTAW